MSAEVLAAGTSWRRPTVRLSPRARLGVLALLALAAIAVFMTIDAKGSWDFVLPFRGRKVAAIVIVGYAIAISTVLFQTITHNRILSPSIMGFDALYMLIQTVVVFLFGASGFVRFGAELRFGLEIAAMVVFAGLLYLWLFVFAARSLHVVALAGIIFGVLFRSLTNFMQRLLEPNDFAVLQDAGFASFNAVDQTLLSIAAAIVVGSTLVLLPLLPVFDALSLGQEIAINLGVDYRRAVMVILVLITALVAVSTALVGPIMFFGLLVANLAYGLIGSPSHRYVLPAAALLAVIALVGGQTVLERVFAFNSSLSIVIEFVGGILFIGLLLRGYAR